jgi:membrane protease YdiL (CAAX protease family)
LAEPTPPPPPQDDFVLARPVRGLTQTLTTPAPRSPLELAELSRREAWLDLGLVMLVALLVPWGSQLAMSLWMGNVSFDAEAIPLLTIQKWFDMLLAGGLRAYLAIRHRLSPACFGLHARRPGRQVLWSLGSLVAAYAWLLAMIIVLSIFILLVPSLEEDLLREKEIIRVMPVHDYLQTVLLLIPVAIHEEVLFRGLLLPYLRRLTGRWWMSILICSVVFGGLHYHQGCSGVILITGVGTVLAVTFVLSRSLLAVILAHFVFDFVQFQFIRLLP